MEAQYVAVVSDMRNLPIAVFDNIANASEWIEKNNIANATVKNALYLGTSILNEHIDAITIARNVCNKTAHVISETVKAALAKDSNLNTYCIRCHAKIHVERLQAGGLSIKERS